MTGEKRPTMASKTQSQNTYHPRDEVDNSWMLELASESEEKKVSNVLSDLDDIPELYPPYDADATADHTDNCPLCGQPRNGPPALPPLGPDDGLNMPLMPPPLVRCLSEHHWDAGKVEMARKKRKRQWVGDHYSGRYDDETDRSGWGYSLARDKVKYRGKIVRRIERITVRYDRDRQVEQEYVDTDVLPIAKQCLAHVTVKENVTGKGAGKPAPRCKNKTYGDYCHIHRHRW